MLRRLLPLLLLTAGCGGAGLTDESARLLVLTAEWGRPTIEPPLSPDQVARLNAIHAQGGGDHGRYFREVIAVYTPAQVRRLRECAWWIEGPSLAVVPGFAEVRVRPATAAVMRRERDLARRRRAEIRESTKLDRGFPLLDDAAKARVWAAMDAAERESYRRACGKPIP